MKLNLTEPPNIKRIGDSAGHSDFCGDNPKTRHSSGSLSSQRTDPLSNLTK